MGSFFPAGFWSTVAAFGAAVCLVFGVDLLFGAKLLKFLDASMNKKISVDKQVVSALETLKKASDQEFNVDPTLMRGVGRYVMCALLFIGAFMIITNVIPQLK